MYNYATKKKLPKGFLKKFLDLADRYFVNPQVSYFLEKGEPQYFDIIGATTLAKRQALGVETPETAVPLSGEFVKIST